MVTGNTRKRSPPYVSYRTFQNFLEQLHGGGVPQRIDRSYWGERLSGSTGMQLVTALRFLNLADTDSYPTPRLKQLAAAQGGQRQDILRQVTNDAYAFLLKGSVDTQTATYSQLEEAFESNYQLTPDVARKCIKFFVKLVDDAGIELSPFVTKKAKTVSIRKSSRRISARTKKIIPVPQTVPEIPMQIPMDTKLLDKFPQLDPAWPDEVKMKWFEAFDQLLKRISYGPAR